jgi:glycosyltransferase involved in cell wall biosynthesis
MMKPLLTIAIPTFNRAEKLRKQLANLTPQLTAEVVCWVYDNASPDNTSEVAAAFQASGVKYHRVEVNGGANRNVLRCFEECQSEWLWVLSDDDPLTTSAVADLLNLIRTCPADFIHTSSHLCQHSANNLVSDIPQLLKQATISSLLWISTGIYRMDKFRPLLGISAESLFTWGSQTVIVLALLGKAQGTVLTSTTTLTISPLIEAPRWSTLDFIIRFCHVPEYLKNPADQKLVAQCICDEQYYWAMLTGLRELNRPDGIHRWQRIRRSSRQTLKSFGSTSPLLQIIKKNNWRQPGKRKTSLRAFHHALLLQLLACCPAFCFSKVLQLLPKPAWLNTLLQTNQGKKSAAH